MVSRWSTLLVLTTVKSAGPGALDGCKDEADSKEVRLPGRQVSGHSGEPGNKGTGQNNNNKALYNYRSLLTNSVSHPNVVFVCMQSSRPRPNLRELC